MMFKETSQFSEKRKPPVDRWGTLWLPELSASQRAAMSRRRPRRETIGATDPKEAAEGTIRKDFATNVQENAVHGSDSNENAEKEIGFFFTQSELTANQ